MAFLRVAGNGHSAYSKNLCLNIGFSELSVLSTPSASLNWREQSGCLYHDLRVRLRNAGLRPTRQRVGLGWLLFARGDRHLTAEGLYEEASKARVPVSLATVYNTLHQFTEAGLLREVAVDGAKTYFDTNTTQHHHFFVEGENRLLDIEGQEIEVATLPAIPDDMEIVRVEVVVRLRRKEV